MTEGRPERSELSAAQRAALRNVEERARLGQTEAVERLTTLCREAGLTPEVLEEAMESVRLHARVAVHFHPDRFGFEPISVAESLLRDGCYRNQFETGSSSGSRTAFASGERDRWENVLFGGAYHGSSVLAEERPKYGALALIHHPDGPSPRFGSCYFVLHASVSGRTSLTFSGSEQELAPKRAGTIDAMECVMAALLSEVANGGRAAVPWPPFVVPTLGVENLTVFRLLGYLCRELPGPSPDPSTGEAGRVLDSCIEAQVHGRIDLERDVESLVIDPAFEGTPTGQVLDEICRRYSIRKALHGGFELSAQAVPDDFRGPEMPRLARRIAGEGMLNAAVIGAAEATLYSRPESWLDWGSPEETRQHLKQLWHVLVQHGTWRPRHWSLGGRIEG